MREKVNWQKLLQKNRQTVLLFGISMGVFLILWTLFIWIIQLMSNNIRVLPYPWTVIVDFFKLLVEPVEGGTLFQHAGISFLRVMIGCLYAFFIGVPLGIFSASNKTLNGIIQPIIELLRPIPPIAWIPFAVISFGLTPTAYAFIIFIGAFFPIFSNTFDGVIQSRKIYQDVALSLGANKSQIIWEVLFPSISPNIFTGIRISVGVGWMCVIAAELMGVSNAGIGYFIDVMKNYGNYSYMFAGMMMIAFIGLILNSLFKLFEKYKLRWMEKE